MCPLSSLHTSNFRRRAAFDLRPGGQTGPGVNCPQGLLALTPRPQGARGTPTPSCALTSPPGSPSPASQGLAFPPPSQVRNLVNENTTTGARPLQVLRNLRASWEAPRQAGAGAGPGGVGVMGGPCLTGLRPPPAQAQARGRLAPRGQHRLAGWPGRGPWLQLREVLSLLPAQDQPERLRAPTPPAGAMLSDAPITAGPWAPSPQGSPPRLPHRPLSYGTRAVLVGGTCDLVLGPLGPGRASRRLLRLLADPAGPEPTAHSPCLDLDGVLVQPVEHAYLQVHDGLGHPDRHVDRHADDAEVQLDGRAEFSTRLHAAAPATWGQAALAMPGSRALLSV